MCADLVFRKHFSLIEPNAGQLVQIIEREDAETPSLQVFTTLGVKHITNALGDTDIWGTPNGNKVRNFAYIKMFFETFHNHQGYVDAMKDNVSDTITTLEEDYDYSSGIVLFGDLVSSGSQQPDPEYEGQRLLEDSSSDEK